MAQKNVQTINIKGCEVTICFLARISNARQNHFKWSAIMPDGQVKSGRYGTSNPFWTYTCVAGSIVGRLGF